MISSLSYHNHFLDSSDMSRPQTSSSTSNFSRRDENSTDRPSEHELEAISLPNYVEDDDKDDLWGPEGVPTKAPGDISLNLRQLVRFLVKASYKLTEVKGQGVRQRLDKLRKLAEEDRISDSFIHKLNYVVDALDRENYIDAWNYFEVLKNNFPEESSLSWAAGVSLLIRELVPLQRRTRIGSAGVRLRNQ